MFGSKFGNFCYKSNFIGRVKSENHVTTLMTEMGEIDRSRSKESIHLIEQENLFFGESWFIRSAVKQLVR